MKAKELNEHFAKWDLLILGHNRLNWFLRLTMYHNETERQGFGKTPNTCRLESSLNIVVQF